MSLSCMVIRASAAGLIFRPQHEFLAGDAALDAGLIVDHRWPGPDGVQDARTRRRPVGTDSADSAVPDDPS